MHFLGPVALVTSFIQSKQFRKRMHCGMACFVYKPG